MLGAGLATFFALGYVAGMTTRARALYSLTVAGLSTVTMLGHIIL